VPNIPFPELLAPVDDLPPATLITSVRRAGAQVVVRGVSQDNGEVASVTVEGHPARIIGQSAGVADWEVTLDAPRTATLTARATDKAGNVEKTGHMLRLTP
jgi:hypothetical protein